MMHPAFATRRGTRPRGEANLLAIITSKHVSWSNGSAGRPASLEFVAPRFRACLLSSRTFQRERKMDRGGRKREREGASTALQVAVCTHRPYTDARKRASPPLPSHPLTLRSRSGPWNPWTSNRTRYAVLRRRTGVCTRRTRCNRQVAATMG